MDTHLSSQHGVGRMVVAVRQTFSYFSMPDCE